MRMKNKNWKPNIEKQKTTINRSTTLTHGINQRKVEHLLYKYMDG